MLIPMLLIGALSSGGSDDETPPPEPVPEPEPEPEPEAPQPALIRGSEGGDLRDGGEGNDLMLGGLGADDLAGFGGDDFILGEGGSDTLYGGAGRDLLSGGRFGDVLFGGTDADAVVGGAGDDLLYGGTGNDSLFAGTGRDTVFGDDGDDVIDGVDPRADIPVDLVLSPLLDVLPGVLADRLGPDLGTRFEPRILKDLRSADTAEADGDVLSGGAGDDVIFFDMGDTVSGGDGADAFALVYPAGSTPAVIEDYAPGEPIALILQGPPAGAISVAAQPDGSAMVQLDGAAVLLLRGVPATSVALSDIALQGTA